MQNTLWEIAGIDDSVVSDANYGKASVKCEVSFDGLLQ